MVSTRGLTFIGLNIVRALSIIALYLHFPVIGSTVPNQPAGPLWAVVNRLIIIAQTIILVLSEINFPAVIGAAILSHHVDTFTRVSATFLFSIGCLNAFVGLVFRESAKSKRPITSWRVNSPPGFPSAAMSSPSFISTLYTNGTAADDRRGSDFSMDEKKLGFGRQAAASDGCLLSKPI
ncbi:hypothetical protein BJ912DRAFT_987298, partial [Pholiota molesta]